MNISQVKRQIILKVLRAIQGRYLDRKRFLCVAAMSARQEGAISEFEEETFILFIQARIEGSLTVTEWLFKQGFDTRSVTYEDRHEYRQRWVESMIKEFSK